MAQLCAELSRTHPPKWDMEPVVAPGAELTRLLRASRAEAGAGGGAEAGAGAGLGLGAGAGVEVGKGAVAGVEARVEAGMGIRGAADEPAIGSGISSLASKRQRL